MNTNTSASSGPSPARSTEFADIWRAKHIEELVREFRADSQQPRWADPLTGENPSDGWTEFARINRANGSIVPDEKGQLLHAYQLYYDTRKEQMVTRYRDMLEGSPADWFTTSEPEPEIDTEEAERNGRDALIRIMHANSMTIRDLEQKTGLSRSAIGRIIAVPAAA